MIALLFAYRHLIVYAGAAVVLMAIGWHAHKAITDAENARLLEAAINQVIQDQEKTRSVGMDLETGLNQYRAIVRDIDRRLHDASNTDTITRFDANSVRSASDRIAAGETSRELID